MPDSEELRGMIAADQEEARSIRSREEFDFVFSAVSRNIPVSLIYTAYSAKFGVGPGTWQKVSSLVDMCRIEIHSRAVSARRNQQARSLAFYQSVVGDDNAKMADRLKAQERIDKLLALEEPPQIELWESLLAKLPKSVRGRILSGAGRELPTRRDRSVVESSGEGSSRFADESLDAVAEELRSENSGAHGDDTDEGDLDLREAPQAD